jgi:hypothetical protein
LKDKIEKKELDDQKQEKKKYIRPVGELIKPMN